MDNFLSDILICLRSIDTKLRSLVDSASKSKCEYTLFRWLDIWFDTYRAPKLRDHGYDLRHTIDKHIKVNIMDKPLNDYTAQDIQQALNCISSERMQQIARQVYNQSFREAVRAGHILRNPVDNVSGVKHTYKLGRSLTIVQEQEFRQLASNDRYRLLYEFYLLTGCRPSEPFLILWTDVSDTTLHIPGTKTTGADRVLPLSDNLRLLLNDIPRDDTRIFPHTYGAVYKHFKDVLLPRLSFHMTIKDLRHTFGTRCIEAGVSMKVVQKWLGHTNFGTTANIYSHVTTQFELAELSKLNSH